ncbi:SPOSA6832_04021 [Sporobolomyces salmonicolor]|uniref:SPOSA6832_04021-mRNA-1:cds n=1 Tax=Sporidiobolus salmonicolor TaxID=5005 RepID=A0A0D6EQV1_SPOSA|nr:SPOSA6832_04021 [Sporobolomyces salmonicolor]
MVGSAQGFARSVGGFSSVLFRLVAYIFLRWIPGRFGYAVRFSFLRRLPRELNFLRLQNRPYLLPAFFLVHTVSTIVTTRSIPSQPSTPAEAALVPSNPSEAPSFADVVAGGAPATEGNAVYEDHPHATPSPPPGTPNGSLSRRKKKKGGANRELQLSGKSSVDTSDSEPGTPTTLSKLQKLPRNRPQPKATFGQLLTSLVFGTPTPTSRFLNFFSWTLNFVVFLLAMDAIWTPVFGMDEASLAFVRVGAVSHNTVKLVARIPPESSLIPGLVGAVINDTATAATASEGFLPVDDFQGAKVVYRPTKPLGKWIAGPEIHTSEENDWVNTVKLDGLWASTEYEYRLLRPSLQTAHHPAFAHSQTFTTFPDPSLSQPTHYTFASSSCVKPGFPWTGPLGKRTIKGAETFLSVAEKVGVRFLMFLGDFIYADVPWYAGAKVEQYNKRYRQVFASPEMKKMVEKIRNKQDYSGNDTSPEFTTANSAYHTYFGNANPDSATPGVNYYDFRVGDSAFFVWDTRAHRSPNEVDDDQDKTMLGQQQREAFFDWAARVNQTVTWKFVVSSVPLMTLWSESTGFSFCGGSAVLRLRFCETGACSASCRTGGINASALAGHGEDTWASFTTERDVILDVLQYVPNVIVLSGVRLSASPSLDMVRLRPRNHLQDRHEFAAASIRTTVTEFSTSPFNMFYLPIRTLSQNHSRGATGEDVLLNYLPDGNTKFTTFEVDTRVTNKPVVRVKVYIDAEDAESAPTWEVEPLALGGAKAKESAVGGLGKSLAELLSFLRRSWF